MLPEGKLNMTFYVRKEGAFDINLLVKIDIWA